MDSREGNKKNNDLGDRVQRTDNKVEERSMGLFE